MAKRLRVAITGATGLLGRNLLFEVIKQNMSRLDDLTIFIFGRKDEERISIRNRIERIISDDGTGYLSIEPDDFEKARKALLRAIVPVDMDLDENGLNIKPRDIERLKEGTIDYFFHVAALTDFRDTQQVVSSLRKTNVDGTVQLLKLVSSLSVKQFCYVGSAYSCGETTGEIMPDYVNPDQRFRNPYEVTKLEAEMAVRDFAKRTGVRCRYFRPSTICGRLMERPTGAINKFDVFYSWGGFFLRMKLKEMQGNGSFDIYGSPVNFDVRICFGDGYGINIVPADFAAKVMYQVCLQDDPGDSYHLVNNQETLHSMHLGMMLERINVSGMKRVDSIPEHQNRIEALYYKTVGKIFTPYMTVAPMLFSVKNLAGVFRAAGLSCPDVDDVGFSLLIDYAKQHRFGLRS